MWIGRLVIVPLHGSAPRLASMTAYEEQDGVLQPVVTRTAEAW